MSVLSELELMTNGIGLFFVRLIPQNLGESLRLQKLVVVIKYGDASHEF